MNDVRKAIRVFSLGEEGERVKLMDEKKGLTRVGRKRGTRVPWVPFI